MQRLPGVQEELLLNIASTFLHGICPLWYFLGVPAAPTLDQSSSLWLVSLPPFAPVSLLHRIISGARPAFWQPLCTSWAMAEQDVVPSPGAWVTGTWFSFFLFKLPFQAMLFLLPKMGTTVFN